MEFPDLADSGRVESGLNRRNRSGVVAALAGICTRDDPSCWQPNQKEEQRTGLECVPQDADQIGAEFGESIAAENVGAL